MGRSVVTRPTVRCPDCLLPTRWCVCETRLPVTLPFALDVIMHWREAMRPSSTGHLLQRTVIGARTHRYDPRLGLPPEQVLRSPEVWILHPLGEDLPASGLDPDSQVILLDGSWAQAADMRRHVDRWGRRVRLPLTGRSRYALRAQQGEGLFSTAEALLFLLAALGHQAAHQALTVQFELHVYAGLRSRGRKDEAAAYLASSPARDHFAPFLEKLTLPRPILPPIPPS